MGIYEREYARHGSQGPGSAPPGLGAFARGLTVVQWLVIINVAVFMIDALAPMSAWRAVSMGDALLKGVDKSQITPVFPKPPSTPQGSSLQFAMPIVDANTQQIVGRRTFQWMQPLASIGHFSTARAFLGLEIWRFLSFQFLHANINHLIFNMIGLWFFGPVVEQALRTKKRFLAFYLICGIAGAMVYLFLNLLGWLIPARLPGLLINEIATPLIGASAGIFGVLIACAYVAGDAIMLLMFIIPMRVRTGAYLMFALALGNLLFGGSNAGGDAAHVGGAIAGFFFIRHPHLLHEFFDIANRSKPKVRRLTRPRQESPERVDAILDKVSQHGLHSLSESEKRILRKATEARRGGR